MTDMPPLSSKPVLSLPPNAYPARASKPPQQPPAPTKPEAAPKAKPIAELDLAEKLFGEAMRDGVHVSLAFLDGERFDAVPVAFGKYSYLIRTDDGCERAVFKVALKSIGRAK